MDGLGKLLSVSSPCIFAKFNRGRYHLWFCNGFVHLRINRMCKLHLLYFFYLTDVNQIIWNILEKEYWGEDAVSKSLTVEFMKNNFKLTVR